MTGVTEQRSGLKSQSKAEHQEKRLERIKCNHMVVWIQGGDKKKFRYEIKAVVQLWNTDHGTAIKLKGTSRGNSKGKNTISKTFSL